MNSSSAKSKRSPLLVTGVAGFIGHATARELLDRGDEVIGLDIINDYYDPALKKARLANLKEIDRFEFYRHDVADVEFLKTLMREHDVRRVVHLAAQAGVRYSLENPFAYEHSNIAGHLAVLEACRHADEFEHLVYASSSSVYGDKPLGSGGFLEDEPAANPVSLYAATKRSCELMSQSYSHLFRMRQSGLRFFTVYGPWGRPDMAYFKFTQKILDGEPIHIFGEGKMARDFTYIDDIVAGIIGALDRPPPAGGHRIMNIGGSQPVSLMDMISLLEGALGVNAVKILQPMQPGDVTTTFANIQKLMSVTGYRPTMKLRDGLVAFVKWYREFYG